MSGIGYDSPRVRREDVIVFEGFALDDIDVGSLSIRVRHGGDGPPLLMLHGHPRTHTTWWRVAPVLAERHRVVCPDLVGYGRSSKPPTEADPPFSSKRSMAAAMFQLMAELGHERFAVVGHDRGSYVAFRMALDRPEPIDRLVLIDCVPIGDALRRADARFASRWWHWFFLGQRDVPAERVINLDPIAWYGGDPASMGAENYADYRSAITDPETVRAMCDDYRSGLTVDRDHDDEDRRRGTRVTRPTLVLWSSRDDLFDLYGDQRSVWESWTTDLSVGAIDSGHHVAEQAPGALVDAIESFLAA